jgi:hypothetical protein
MIAVAVVLAIPVAAAAGTVFEDVDDADVHIDGITFLKESGVSIGCDTDNNFCPQDNVTRAQMATFMHRLSGNDENTEQSVDADKVDGFEANQIVRASFDLVDSGALLGVDGTAAETTMVAPTDGFLLIHASAEVDTASTGDTIACEIHIDGALESSSLRQVHVDFPDDPVDVCGTDVAVAVTPGTHDIEFVFSGVLINSAVDEAALTVLYVPFGGELPDLTVPVPPPGEVG